jgi:hypothetical protein
MNSNSFEVKKTLESDLSGPRGSAVAKGYGGTGPAFRPIHVASVTVFPNHRVFFQTFQAEPMALTWPIGPGMLERHQLHRRVSRADLIPCSKLQGEFIRHNNEMSLPIMAARSVYFSAPVRDYSTLENALALALQTGHLSGASSSQV